MAQGMGTIRNDDVQGPPPPTLSIADATVAEGNSGNTPALFTVTLSAATTSAVSVGYTIAGDTATAGTDFVATGGTVTFAAGETQKTITVPVVGDTLQESNERFLVTLSGAVNATIAKASGQGTILDDDGPPASTAVNYTVSDDWGTGFVAGISIQNNATTTISGWTLEFDLAANITSIWNAVIVSHVGNHYVIKPASWNMVIAPGAAINFGFQGTPGNVSRKLTGVLLNGDPV